MSTITTENSLIIELSSTITDMVKNSITALETFRLDHKELVTDNQLMGKEILLLAERIQDKIDKKDLYDLVTMSTILLVDSETPIDFMSAHSTLN